MVSGRETRVRTQGRRAKMVGEGEKGLENDRPEVYDL